MNTHEYLLVTRGEMVLRYGGEEYSLREGISSILTAPSPIPTATAGKA